MKEIKVLIIDDAYFFRNLVKKAIKEKPENENGITFSVLDEAKNGTEGITKYFELKPDLVTLDITMPDIDGIEVAKQILSKDPNAKILAISGNTNDDVKQSILDAGALDYLQKPFQPAYLWNKLDSLYEEKQEEVIVQSEDVLEKEDSKFESTPNKSEIVIIDEPEEDDLFENQEIEIASEPNAFKSQEVTITNENDSIEFPEDYEINMDNNNLSSKEHDIQEKSNDNEHVVEIVDEDDLSFEICPSTPQTPSNNKTVLENEKKQYTNNTNVDYNQQSNFYKNKEYDLEYEETNSRNTKNQYSSYENKEYHPSHNQEKVIVDEKPEEIEEDYDFTPITIRPPRGKVLSGNNSTNNQNDDFSMDDDYEPLVQETSEKGLFAKIKKFFKK